MPIQSCTLPGGGSGFRWGASGKCYGDRKDAERQETAARANGWAGDEKLRSMYVSRKLLNAEALIEWAKAQGFKNPVGLDDMHVTVAYSKQPVQWEAAGDHFDSIRASDIDPGERSVKQLGDQGAVVLCFDNPDLRRRWQEFRDIGASWDWDGYQSHVTFTYEPGDVDLAKVAPYTGALEFGPESFAEVNDDWKPKQAADALLAQDKAMQIKAEPSADALAMDRGTVRNYDQDGRLRIEVANISKANVCPYLGNEIPDWQELGLEPDRTYQLLRDPVELEKAAPTFNGIPLLDTHVPSTAWDHPFGKVVGTTGTDAVFEAPYLQNSLIVWTADAIQGIESGEQRELSCGYRYRPVMEPGNHEGIAFDGRMVDILGNHVALVAAGRAGPDVLVGDSSTVKGNGMTKVKAIARKAAALRGALLVSPKLRGFAADAKVSAITAAITQANWKTERPKLEAAIKPKLAADADMQDLVQLLDAIEQTEEGMDDDPAAITQPAVDADPVAEILAMLKGKVSDEELAGIAQKLQAMKPAAAADVDPDKKPGEEKDMVSKSAMDTALKAASDKAAKDIKAAADSARSEAEENTIKRLRSVREAEEAALPYAGKLAGAFDSAEAVYRAALTALDVKHDGIHESALRAVLEAQPKPGASRTFAHDSTPSADFAKRFPGAAAVRIG
jgi:uncharacterized protein